MNYLKALGLAAVAAAALMAIIGVGTASATVLCHSTSTPCSEPWEGGTEIRFTVKAGTAGVWQDTGGSTSVQCPEGEVRGNISAGGETETVKIPIEAGHFTWPGCTVPAETLEGGELEIHAISGSDNGAVTAKGFNFTTTFFGVTCSYTFPEATSLGTLTSSSTGHALIDIHTPLTKKSGGFLCPATITWIEELEQTNPGGTPLYVEPS